MNRFGIIALMAGALFAADCRVTRAAQPWQTLLPFKKIDADPKKDYKVAESNGPWMILATVFRGPDAEDKAHQLVLELRKKHRLQAYQHTKVFDYSQEKQVRGVRSDGTPQTMRNWQDQAVKECAVLVGNFSAIDDPSAAETLKKIKTLDVETLKSPEAKSSQAMSEVRNAMLAKRKKGPMGSAFVATNPLLPPEYFNARGMDKLVLEMNKEVAHSLLECHGKYTLKVATFTGSAVIDQRKVKEVMQGGKLRTRLQEAAEKAHLLTEELRARGYEAYEFHNRDMSIVTIGSFESPDMPGSNGQSVPNPEIEKLKRDFGLNVSTNTVAAVSKVALPIHGEIKHVQERFTKTKIQLDLNPVVMQVPKRSISSSYQRQ